MRRTRWVDKKNCRITQYMPTEMKIRIACAKDLAVAAEAEASRPRLGPKDSIKFLPYKEPKSESTNLRPYEPLEMITKDKKECTIIEETIPGMAGEPLTIAKVQFEDGTVKDLNSDTISLFDISNRIKLEEYLKEIEELNYTYAKIWTE
jgi:hypothetical protein